MPVEINNLTKAKVDIGIIKKVGEVFLKKIVKKDKEISVAIIADKKMAELNKQCRNKIGTTDVLSFEGEGKFLGEIVLNWQQIKRQARELGEDPSEELAFIFSHGLFHLIGFDDATDKNREEMIKMGKEFLKKNKLVGF